MIQSGRTRAVTLLFAGVLLVEGCGGSSHFKNDPRPAPPLQVTGVITDERVTISPDRVGAGPAVLIVSNQSQQAWFVTLEGEGTKDMVGPVNPLDTAKVQQTLKQGHYTVTIGSKQATSKKIAAGSITVGPPRESSGNQLLLP
jgi:hypothetical protein